MLRKYKSEVRTDDKRTFPFEGNTSPKSISPLKGLNHYNSTGSIKSHGGDLEIN